MEKITRENIENEYKEAIRKKYRIEKVDGEYSHYLANPSQAALRDLCWEVFNLEPKADDLFVYRNFFRFEFNSREENTSTQYTDKFKKVGAFLRGGIKPAKITTVELAAILVDYEPRPFKKFKERGIILIEEPIGSPKTPFPFNVNNNEDEDKDKDEEEEYEEEEEEEEEYEEDEYEEDEIEEGNEEYQDHTNSPNNLDLIIVNEEQIDEDPVSAFKEEEVEVKVLNTRVNLFLKIKRKILNRFKRRIKVTAMIVAIIFGLVSAVIYFAFFKNHCMQWSDDHYEVVNCSSKNRNTNEIIPLDNDLLDFRKLKACDTTTCFKKNGEAFVWYSKTHNGIDFFNDNGNGRHPECNNSLRPVTQYIFNKYLKGKPCY